MQINRIPSLDGIRAISILLVVLGHLIGTHNFPWAGSPLYKYFAPYAGFGVEVFFVISGFLITTLLLKEREKTGKIDLKQFYLRRTIRIFPAAYAYLLIVIPVAWSTLDLRSMVQAVTYTMNYNSHKAWVLGHLWSLSVEEQFYLLWPSVMALAFASRKKVIIGTIAAAPFLRIVVYLAGYDRIGQYFPTVADALATGCLLALIQPTLERHLRVLTNNWFLASTLVATVLIAQVQPVIRVWVFAVTFMQIGMALCIFGAVKRQYAFLNTAPMRWLGVLSYSLYLWQQPFLNRNSTAIWAAFPLNIILALGAACASYYFVEKPFLAMRKREPANPPLSASAVAR